MPVVAPVVPARTVAPFSDKPGSQNRTAEMRKRGIWEIVPGWSRTPAGEGLGQTGSGACSGSGSDRDGGTTNL